MKLRVGEIIKRLRKEREITQEEFAEVLGVSCQSVSRWEKGTCYPDMPNYEHNNDVDILSDGYSLMPGVWYHVCAVKAGKELQLYLNGKLIASGTSRGRGPYNWKNGAKFYVGGSMTNLASLTGWVDEVQIWSKALSEAEVKEVLPLAES